MTIGQDLRGTNDIFEPKPSQIWEIDDEKVRFVPDDTRTEHEKRFVLIVMDKELCTTKNKVFNIIPLSSKGSPDILRYPLTSSCFSTSTDDFLKKDTKSLLVLSHYQPIYSDFLKDHVGSIQDYIYDTILQTLKCKLLGIKDDEDIQLEDYV